MCDLDLNDNESRPPGLISDSDDYAGYECPRGRVCNASSRAPFRTSEEHVVVDSSNEHKIGAHEVAGTVAQNETTILLMK